MQCWRQFFHYKSMGKLFSAQGQVNPKLKSRSGPNSNLSEILCLSWSPLSLMKFRSKLKALWSPQRADYSKVNGWM